MKKICILLMFSLLLSGCESKDETKKNEYLAMKSATFNEKNFTKEELPVDIVTTIERINDETINYKTAITNPKENMHDVKVMLVHNYQNEDVYPTIGVFDKPKELLVDNNESSELTLTDTINTTKNISKLGLELKLLIEYTDDLGEKKDIYYKMT